MHNSNNDKSSEPQGIVNVVQVFVRLVSIRLNPSSLCPVIDHFCDSVIWITKKDLSNCIGSSSLAIPISVFRPGRFHVHRVHYLLFSISLGFPGYTAALSRSCVFHVFYISDFVLAVSFPLLVSISVQWLVDLFLSFHIYCLSCLVIR